MDNKPFNKYYVLRITSLHIKKSVDTSIRKTYDRLKDVENKQEVFETLDVLHKIIFKHTKLNKFDVFNVASNNSLSTYEIASIVKNFLNSNAKIICSNKKYMFDWDVYVDNSKIKKELDVKLHSLENAVIKYLKNK